MSETLTAFSLLFNVITTSYIIYKEYFRPKEFDKSEIMIDRLKDQLKFYSPLVSSVERVDYRAQRTGDPKGIILEIIRQENVEKEYKMMAEPDFKMLLAQILGGNLMYWNTWLDVHDEFVRLVSTDFKKLQEKYNSLLK